MFFLFEHCAVFICGLCTGSRVSSRVRGGGWGQVVGGGASGEETGWGQVGEWWGMGSVLGMRSLWGWGQLG